MWFVGFVERQHFGIRPENDGDLRSACARRG
jgi:hypothetical protein